MKKIFLLLLLSLFAITIFSCKSTELDGTKGGADSELNLDAEGVSASEGVADKERSLDNEGEDNQKGVADKERSLDNEGEDNQEGVADNEGGVNGGSGSDSESVSASEGVADNEGAADAASGNLENVIVVEAEKFEPDEIPEEISEEKIDAKDIEISVVSGKDSGVLENTAKSESTASQIETSSSAKENKIQPQKNIPPSKPATPAVNSAQVNSASGKSESKSDSSVSVKSNPSSVNTPKNSDASSNPPVVSVTASGSDSEQSENLDGTVNDDGTFNRQKEIVPSRKMNALRNQFIDIVYPGSGWIYLGEADRENKLIFSGRKLGANNTTFTLRTQKAGKALLHFFKNDLLTGKYIDDYLEINIEMQTALSSEHIEAPSYADVVPQKPERKTETASENSILEDESVPESEGNSDYEFNGESARPEYAENSRQNSVNNAPEENVQTKIQTSGNESEKSDQLERNLSASRTQTGSAKPQALDKAKSEPDITATSSTGRTKGSLSQQNLLEQAQKAYDEKRYAEALELVQQFFDAAVSDYDKGLFLEAQILEAKSEVQNIKSAIDAYDTLVKNYPQSTLWNLANRRSIYLRRFYIDIR